MIPENSLDTMLEAYVQSGSPRPLVVVGGATYDSPFHRRLREIAARAEGRIRFLGHVHDEELLRELWCNCFGYLHGHSVGGTNPALLNAMGYGSCILALDTVFNREVLGGTGLLFPAEPAAPAAMREPPRERVRAEYSWEKITRQYEELFLEVAP
jgi:glycosyltransferase involved in cell wall biosynthesis